ARLRLGRRAAVVTQPAVAAHAARATESLRGAGFEPVVLEVPEGEEAKSLRQAERLWDGFLAHGLDRASPVVAVGGGVVGDLAGFAAASFMRGVPVVQVPTTLLAQVDASVGGKVAVNHPRGKNLIGAFHQPRLVLIDPETLRTLPEREYRSGLAEVVKTGAALDAALFASLETGLEGLRRRDPGLLEAVVAACCAQKARIVEQDEREETGVRMVLNYGHTVGHALEALSGYRRWLHGEAVAIGMAAAGRLAVRLGWTDAGTVERQDALLQGVGLPVRFTGLDPRQIADALRHDKKARDGRVPFVLLRTLGRAELCYDVPTETVIEVLREIQG
ncbi:MAG: 3-dehydroquinate synthase, partial [Candidatus Rokuibacteriota bacterium]